jgi:hypothetical protein
VAQLRYSANTHYWGLYWADRNGRWRRYEDLDPGPVDSALNEIEADPTASSGAKGFRFSGLRISVSDGPAGLSACSADAASPRCTTVPEDERD